jgi:hypothetical protein
LLRLRRALAVVSLSSAAAATAGAQQASVSDSLRPAIPSIEAARAGAPAAQSSSSAAADGTSATSRRHDRLPIVFYSALGTAAGAAAMLHVDPDSGGYRDGWTTATDFPDKAVHALAAWAITTVGVDLGARPRHAALAVCAAGTAFEFAQGYASPYDIAADCIGATGAAIWQSWRARRRDRAAAAKAAIARQPTAVDPTPSDTAASPTAVRNTVKP